MAPRSRTGRLMQGLFGRFGKKNPNQPSGSPANPRRSNQVSRSEFRDDENITEPELEFPRAEQFDDDEETNWDDAETLVNEDNPWTQPAADRIAYAQPIVTVVAPTIPPILPDLEDWDEALPAATVQHNNVQEVRRGKQKSVPESAPEDIWDDNLPNRAFSPVSGINLDPPSQRLRPPVQSSLIESAIGLWAASLQQLRRLFPNSMRQLSDPILTGIVVIFITVGIWFINSFFAPKIANVPDPVTANQPNSIPAIIDSPEQTFIETIQRQISNITSQYPDGIIQTLNIDVDRDRLIVRLNPSWYLMSVDHQNQLTAQMWRQAKENHFSKLEVQDSDGNSIARSPVVGREMIILQRIPS
jgi:hypothetical protein